MDSVAEPGDTRSNEYDALVGIGLRANYRGVLNEFLARELSALGVEAVVLGEPEFLYPCPCCRYRSLAVRARLDICKVCFWEDDGQDDLDRFSGPNHLTLREARAAFEWIGAVTRAMVPNVLADGPARYSRG